MTDAERLRAWKDAYAAANGKPAPKVLWKNGTYRIYHEAKPSYRTSDELELMTVILKDWSEKRAAEL